MTCRATWLWKRAAKITQHVPQLLPLIYFWPLYGIFNPIQERLHELKFKYYFKQNRTAYKIFGILITCRLKFENSGIYLYGLIKSRFYIFHIFRLPMEICIWMLQVLKVKDICSLSEIPRTRGYVRLSPGLTSWLRGFKTTWFVYRINKGLF